MRFLMNYWCPRLREHEHLWNDSLLARLLFAHHGVALSCPRLSIRKNAHVVSYNSKEINVGL